jgi:hypothetical protein
MPTRCGWPSCAGESSRSRGDAGQREGSDRCGRRAENRPVKRVPRHAGTGSKEEADCLRLRDGCLFRGVAKTKVNHVPNDGESDFASHGVSEPINAFTASTRSWGTGGTQDTPGHQSSSGWDWSVGPGGPRTGVRAKRYDAVALAPAAIPPDVLLVSVQSHRSHSTTG